MRLKNRLIAKVTTRFPGIGKRLFSGSVEAQEPVPWTPLQESLDRCRAALVTTAGVHHVDQVPFDMQDPDGDPSFRVIDGNRPVSDLMITHDYYDHADADKDINIVFPIARLKELAAGGGLGSVARYHYAFMGHITGRHIHTLVHQSAPEVARRLKEAGADVVLLTPG